MDRRVTRLGSPVVVVLAGLIAASAAWPAGGGGTPAKTQLTSRGPNGLTVHTESSTYGVSVSASGRYVLFTSEDDALPGADDTRDVYLRDRRRGRTILISKSTSGEPANDGCGDGPAISADGSVVAFECSADNLGGNVEDGLYVRDLERKTTKLVSRSSNGDPASDGGDRPGLSANGRFVAFESDSDNLPGADGTIDAYVRDLKRKRTELVSKATNGTPADDNSSRYPSISASGRFAVFFANSDLLPGGDSTADVYVRDRKLDRTILASRASNGKPGNGGSICSPGAISANGRLVVFESNAANLGASLNGTAIVRDLVAGKTRVISRTTTGGLADGEEPAIAPGGRFVVYTSDDDDLPGGSGTLDIYRFDRKTKRTILISQDNSGEPGGANSYYPSASRDGSVVGFTSNADNLSPLDDNDYPNTFARVLP